MDWAKRRRCRDAIDCIDVEADADDDAHVAIVVMCEAHCANTLAHFQLELWAQPTLHSDA